MLAVPSLACCIPCFCFCSCWLRHRLPNTFRRPRSPGFLPSSAGPWRKSTLLRFCCAARVATRGVLAIRAPRFDSRGNPQRIRPQSGPPRCGGLCRGRHQAVRRALMAHGVRPPQGKISLGYTSRAQVCPPQARCHFRWRREGAAPAHRRIEPWPIRCQGAICGNRRRAPQSCRLPIGCLSIIFQNNSYSSLQLRP